MGLPCGLCSAKVKRSEPLCLNLKLYTAGECQGELSQNYPQVSRVESEWERQKPTDYCIEVELYVNQKQAVGRLLTREA